ncbi:methyltransferase family protein [Ideonella sp.]|uniref:methyltransferase family protein n=1 Tax=Ideonella sp. TaxID=1929293 RepID=UPI0037C08FEB
MAALELKIPPLAQLVVAALLAIAIERLTPGLTIQYPYAVAAAIFLAVAGAGIAVAGVVAFRRKGTTVNPLDPGRSTKMVRDGVYRFSRNPMYLGMLLMLAAVVLYLSNVAAALVALPLFVWYMNRFQIVPEERFLQQKFGEEYTQFLREVRRWA